MKVVELRKTNLTDVPACLRVLADKMENGDVRPSAHCIVVSEGPDGGIDLYGYGEVGTRATEVGLLQMAVVQMAIV
jgi:hypothetical protein